LELSKTRKIMKKYKITIGEPWNFEGPDGQNLIKGTVLKYLDNRNIIFKSNYPITLQNETGDLFILSFRFRDKDVSHLKDKPVNGGLILSDHIDGLSAEEIKQKSKFVLIGTLIEDS